MPAGGKPYGPKSGRKPKESDYWPGDPGSGRFRTESEKKAAGRQINRTQYAGRDQTYGDRMFTGGQETSDLFNASNRPYDPTDRYYRKIGDEGRGRMRMYGMGARQSEKVARTALGGADRAASRARGTGMTKTAASKARGAGQAMTGRTAAAGTNKGRGAAPTKKAAPAKKGTGSVSRMGRAVPKPVAKKGALPRPTTGRRSASSPSSPKMR